MHIGVIIHEMLHALGFFHEQSRADRDHWIWIDFDKTDPGRFYTGSGLTLTRPTQVFSTLDLD